MRLKDGFITYDTGEEHLMVPVGKSTFSGLVRSNETAAYIIDCLKSETTREKLEDSMMEQYGITREQASRDVEKVFSTLRQIGALDE